jgi:hypothetical protein
LVVQEHQQGKEGRYQEEKSSLSLLPKAIVTRGKISELCCQQHHFRSIDSSVRVTQRPVRLRRTFTTKQSLPTLEIMFSRAVLAASLLASSAINTVDAISTISVTGSKFFDSNGSQFYIKG